MYWSCGRHLVFYKPRYCTNSVGFPRWQLTAEGSHKSSTATGKRTRFWLEARYQKPLEIQVCQRRCEDHQFYSPSPSCLIYLSDILLTATLSVESLTPVAGGTTIACRLTVSSGWSGTDCVDGILLQFTFVHRRLFFIFSCSIDSCSIRLPWWLFSISSFLSLLWFTVITFFLVFGILRDLIFCVFWLF